MPALGRDDAICAATLELLAEVGYERMSMDAIAERARASKATIYRRWSGKHDLVLDALGRRHDDPASPEDRGSLRGDLLAVLRALADRTGCEEVELMSGVLREMRHEPEIGACLRDQVLERKRALFATIVERAVARGELPPGARADLAHEVAGALWVQHTVVLGADVDDAFIAHVADDVLIPLLSAHRPQERA